MAGSDTRHAKMSVDLGGEQVLLKHARCTETLAGSFELEVDIIATLGEVNLHPHLGQPVGVQVHGDDEPTRYFHGLIVGGEFVHERAGRHSYRLHARPFTHFMAHNRNMAIFQTLSVPDIIKQVLTAGGHDDFRFVLSGSYPPRDYCVQYRESDLTFITRLMEEEGIYYFWRHEAGRHEMVICDSAAAHPTGTPASIRFNPFEHGEGWATANRTGGGTHFLNRFSERVASGGEGVVTRRAFDFKKPERPLQAQESRQHKHAGRDREFYDYPTAFVDEGRGNILSTRQLLALRRNRQVYSGESQAIGLACGTTVAVQHHPTDRLNATYLVTHTEHVIQNEAFWSEPHARHEPREDRHTHTSFRAIPVATQFHLPHETPRPAVQGLETAIVSGPPGEEIYTDDYGRVKVRFHWDRKVDAQGNEVPDDRSTCWIRVAQFGGLGNVILPRIGQEVMVDFLHGNPDEPIVVGWVFNQAQMPVYKLPKHRARHVMRGRSYPGGQSTQFPETMPLDTGNPGANEFRFDDTSGEEEVFLHAEKDLKSRVRHDSTLQVGHNETILIGRDRNDEVRNDETTKIGKNQTLDVVGDQTETIEAKRAIEVKDADKLKVGQTQTIEVGTDITIKAGTSITIKVGGSKIVIDNAGITLDAPTITIKGGTTAKLTSPMTTVEGSGMTTVTGGMVMIN